MKIIIKESQLRLLENVIKESNDDVLTRLNDVHDGLFEKVSHNPNFNIIDGRDVTYYAHKGTANRCETNAYQFVKERGGSCYPVSGFLINKNGLGYFEHWWVYDSLMEEYLEVTPIGRGESSNYYYAGVTNKDINDKIKNSNIVWDINFFKGGNFYYSYLK